MDFIDSMHLLLKKMQCNEGKQYIYDKIIMNQVDGRQLIRQI